MALSKGGTRFDRIGNGCRPLALADIVPGRGAADCDSALRPLGDRPIVGWGVGLVGLLVAELAHSSPLFVKQKNRCNAPGQGL